MRKQVDQCERFNIGAFQLLYLITMKGRNYYLTPIFMKTILTHYVQMDKYEVPNHIAKKKSEDIEDYISQKNLKPVSGDSRDWEMVDVL